MLELAELPVLSHVRLLAHSHLEPNFWDPTISGNSEHFSFFLTTHYGVGGGGRPENLWSISNQVCKCYVYKSSLNFQIS